MKFNSFIFKCLKICVGGYYEVSNYSVIVRESEHYVISIIIAKC
jgi:hypothetical protein